MRGKHMLSNARTKAHIYTKDVYEANYLDDEDDVIFLKKGTALKDLESSPQSIMHHVVPDMEAMMLPDAVCSPEKPPQEETAPSEDEDEESEKSLSKARLPIKLSGGEVGLHSRMARYEKNKARALSKKYWARKRAVQQAARDDLEAVEEDDSIQEQWAPPIRASSKVREKARRVDRRSARDAKCASWYDNELETVSFEVPERPETRFILIDRPVIYVPVIPTADPVFQELIAEDRVISVPRIPVKIGGADEIGVHSRMARREKKNARELSKKHWGRVRAVAKRTARADHEARFVEEAGAEFWPPAPQYTKAGVKARRLDRRAARNAKCTSWCENELETLTFAAKPPKAKVEKKECRPWLSRTELPVSVQVVDPEFKALVVNEVHAAVEAELHCHMAKRGKKQARELYKKFWSKKREAKAAHAKFEASLLADDKSEEEDAPPPPIRSGAKIREKARRAARRDARGAKCAAWADDESAGHEVFSHKGWLEAMRPEMVGMRDVMYEDVSSEASEAASPVSTIVNASRMTQVSRARLKLSFGEAIRSKPISSIRKAHEIDSKVHRRNIVETARAA